MKNTKGITLIALIITIIVMLILVAVSISVALNTGLFKSAGDATRNWKSAQDAEANVGSEIKIGDKTYGSIEDYLEGNEKVPEGAGKRFNETKEYTDGIHTAWVPAGFTISGIKSETTIDGGLVIYDIPTGEDVDWTNPDSVKTAYNQFVWIPVEVNKKTDDPTNIEKFYRTQWSNNERSTKITDYSEPDIINDTADKTGITSQIERLTQSIYRYGGFYVGRYEAGSTTERDSLSGVTTLGIKQDMYPYNYVKWGDSSSSIGTEGAVYLSNCLYNSTEYGATSMLCTGAAWDGMLDFIKDSNHDVTDCANWGNYRDNTFQITRGQYAEYVNNTLGSFNQVNGIYKKEQQSYLSNIGIVLSTGATDRNLAKNIYDVAGNCREWTTESDTSEGRILRGGMCLGFGSLGQTNNERAFYDPASARNSFSTTISMDLVTFRPILYVKL